MLMLAVGRSESMPALASNDAIAWIRWLVCALTAAERKLLGGSRIFVPPFQSDLVVKLAVVKSPVNARSASVPLAPLTVRTPALELPE